MNKNDSYGKFLRGLNKIIYSPINFGCDVSYIKKVIYVGRLLYPEKFTDTDPFKIVYVDPQIIKYSREEKTLLIGWGRTYNKRYKKELFDKCLIHKSMKRHFEEGVGWENTELYKRRAERIKNNRTAFACSTIKELDKRMKNLDCVYESIRNKGYKTQHELFQKKPKETISLNSDAIHPFLNEICLDIGPKGELIRTKSGRHRLSMAKILQLDSVPALIRARHRKWEKYRANSTNNNSIRNHPDLNDLYI